MKDGALGLLRLNQTLGIPYPMQTNVTHMDTAINHRYFVWDLRPRK